MEDFVGSGEQAFRILNELCKAFENSEMQILFSPLIVMDSGYGKFLLLEEKYPNCFSFRPMMHFGNDFSVCKNGVPNERYSHSVLREILESIYSETELAFGFNAVGSYVVLFSNCPNNNLKILYDDMGGEYALFPRVDRQELPPKYKNRKQQA